MPEFYISFATDEEFLGGTIVEAPFSELATFAATLQGRNPGGEALILELPPDLAENEDVRQLRQRLLSKEELLANGGKILGDFTPEEQEELAQFVEQQ
jgi:hypothetical protein